VEDDDATKLSEWAYDRILKLASTITDLARREETQPAHLADTLHASQSTKVKDRAI
jgi:predicted ATPase with chaperone activity